MAYRVEISPPALDEVETIFQYLSESSADIAYSWFNDAEGAIESLGEMPLRCGLAYESYAFQIDVRQLLFGTRSNQYRILFSVTGDVVQVHHIRHTRQQLLNFDNIVSSED